MSSNLFNNPGIPGVGPKVTDESKKNFDDKPEEPKKPSESDKPQEPEKPQDPEGPSDISKGLGAALGYASEKNKDKNNTHPQTNNPANNKNIPDYIKEKRCPNDYETILKRDPSFKKTNRTTRTKARIYEKDGRLYHRDQLRKGQDAHLEVYDKRGNHLGIADPQTGELIPETKVSGRKIDT